MLRLDTPGSEWQVDLELRDRNPRGLRLYQAISTLQRVHFTVDSTGRQLATPADLLLAAVWKRGSDLDVFSRSAGPGASWSKMTISEETRGDQIRAFALHKDQITGQEIVFAGAKNSIFVGKFDAEHKNIVWNPQPEWQWHDTLNVEHPDRARVASFAECNGKLYATSHAAIYERADGASPTWNKVFETTIHSAALHVTGLRGLTCVRDSTRSTNVLLVGVEDSPSRIYRIDPRETDPIGQYEATLELDVSSFLTKTLGTEATYAIVAYNDMTEYSASAGACPHLLIGLETITPQASAWFGDRQHFNPYAHYLVRDCAGNYALREIRDEQIEPEPQLVSVRTFAVSPFQSDPPGAVYAGGFDANYNPVHNTAWLYRGVPAAR